MYNNILNVYFKNMRQDALNAPNITPSQHVINIVIFPPNALYTKATTLPTIKVVKFTGTYKNFVIKIQESTNQF